MTQTSCKEKYNSSLRIIAMILPTDASEKAIMPVDYNN